MFYRSLTEKQTTRLRRALPVIALALVAFAVGAIVGANHASSPADSLAARFVAEWTRGDYAAMYVDIDTASQRTTSADQFARDYQQALRTATADGVKVVGKPRNIAGGLIAVPVRIHTHLFGALPLSFQLRILPDAARSGEGLAIVWSPSLAFPGLRPGEALSRRTAMPPRASLLARDGSVLAEGSASTAADRSSPLGGLASALLGEVGPVPSERRDALEAQGVPPDAIIGTSGLERALDDRLRGTPGGELLAEGAGGEQAAAPGQSTGQDSARAARVLASAVPHAARAVRTTISPAVQREAVTALGGQLGGIVAMQPSTGQVLAVAGIGLDSVQPPGSTFKMITLTSALQAHIATPHTVFPYASFSTLDGVRLNNANGENCGGTLQLAFAVSCNSVFAPLGVKVGAANLVATAERFGFNHEPGIEGASESTLPRASQIQGELAVGSTAIGQGQVQASALEMAVVAATIADGGRRQRPTFTPLSPPSAGTAATSRAVARTVRSLMIGVVREGTGTAAAIPGVVVAGKTGTAELKTVCPSSSSESASGESSGKESSSATCQGPANEASNTDAWFAAFAPALHPRVVVGVLLVKDGAGGATAAPVARQVLEAGLRAGR
jgi:penicillin-binding protein A